MRAASRAVFAMCAAVVACILTGAANAVLPDPEVVTRGDFTYAHYTIPANSSLVPVGDFGYDVANKVCTDNGLSLLTLDDAAEYTDLFTAPSSLFPEGDFLFNGSSNIWLGLTNTSGTVAWSDGKTHDQVISEARLSWMPYNSSFKTCQDSMDGKCCAALWFFQRKNLQPTFLYYPCDFRIGVNRNRDDGINYQHVICKGKGPLRGVCGGEGFSHMACYNESKTVYAVNKSKSECINQFLISPEGLECKGEIYFWGHNQFGCGTFLDYKFNSLPCRENYLAYESSCTRMVKNNLLTTEPTPYQTKYRCTGEKH